MGSEPLIANQKYYNDKHAPQAITAPWQLIWSYMSNDLLSGWLKSAKKKKNTKNPPFLALHTYENRQHIQIYKRGMYSKALVSWLLAMNFAVVLHPCFCSNRDDWTCPGRRKGFKESFPSFRFLRPRTSVKSMPQQILVVPPESKHLNQPHAAS